MSILDNVKIYDSDNKFVGFTSFQKANWLIKKNLAVAQNDVTITINFVPRKYLIVDDNSIEEYKVQNKCVVCGLSEEETKSEYTELNHIFIVPMVFIRKYPLEIRKNQRSTKKIIICIKCNNLYSKYIMKKKNEMIDKFGITKNNNITKAKIFAKSILKLDTEDKRYLNKINSIEQLLNIKITQQSDITNILSLCEYIGIDDKLTPEEYIVHHYIKQDKLDEFEQIWIHYFLEIMKPLFLPKLWKDIYNLE
jgi:uncharacterized CHY-type Zn-finger protein